jgi:WD40 repeat protein
MNRPRRVRTWRRRAAAWGLGFSILLLLLALSLHRRASPWELQLLIPSGYSEAEFVGFESSERDRCADLTPDGKRLAIGKASGQCEIWDIQKSKRIAVLGDRMPNKGIDYPALGGARNVQWLGNGSGIVVERDDGYFLFPIDGTERILVKPPFYDRSSAVSPDSSHLALADTDSVKVVDIASGIVKQHWKLESMNGGRRRLDWTREGQYLLLNDLLGVWVWDIAAGKEVFHHLPLDLTLPPPMLSDDPTHAANGPVNRSLEAAYADSQFSPDGRVIASIYDHLDHFWSSVNSGTSRLRFYETTTGKLLWDTVLPQAPASMSFSQDGSRLYLLVGPNDGPSLLVYDPSKHQLLTNAPCPIVSSHPVELVPLPDDHTLAGTGRRLTVFDSLGHCVPLGLNGSPNATCVMATPDGQQLIEVGKERTVRIWHKRRELSVLGAFALPETWGLYIGSVVMIAGIVSIAAKMQIEHSGKTCHARSGQPRSSSASCWEALWATQSPDLRLETSIRRDLITAQNMTRLTGRSCSLYSRASWG